MIAFYRFSIKLDNYGNDISTNENTESSNSNNDNVEVNDDTVEVPLNDDEHEEEPQSAPKSNEDKSKKVSFMLDVESKAIIETLVDSLEGFNVENLMKLLPRLIMHVENYKNLSGENKKALVIRMLNHIIDITDCPGDDAILDPIMKRMVPGMIDLLVDVEHHLFLHLHFGSVLQAFKVVQVILPIYFMQVLHVILLQQT